MSDAKNLTTEPQASTTPAIAPAVENAQTTAQAPLDASSVANASADNTALTPNSVPPLPESTSISNQTLTDNPDAAAPAAVPTPASPPATTPQIQKANEPTASSSTSNGFITTLLTKARVAIQNRKQKKLQKILALIEQKGKMKNEDVRKLLKTSQTTATRYLDQLEKIGKIKTLSKGKATYYVLRE